MDITNRPDIERELVRLTAAEPGIALADLAGILLPFYTESHVRGTVRMLAARGALHTTRAGGRVYVYPPAEAATCSPGA